MTFIPLSDQELSGLSNVEISPAEPDSDLTSEESDSDDGWETTEELGDDGDVNDQENDV